MNYFNTEIWTVHVYFIQMVSIEIDSSRHSCRAYFRTSKHDEINFDRCVKYDVTAAASFFFFAVCRKLFHMPTGPCIDCCVLNDLQHGSK